MKIISMASAFEKYKAVLSIAGYDPSGGAGVLADCKTFEQTGVYGCAVTTGITWQNDDAFYGIKWLSFEEIENQFNSVAERFEFEFVKIGLVESLEILESIIRMLKDYNHAIKILWDPIFKASAGFVFHNALDKEKIEKVLSEIYLLTPNLGEAKVISDLILTHDKSKPAIDLSDYCNILLKGGHSESDFSTDILYHGTDNHELKTEMLSGYSKHGSGCVLSAAIVAYLAKGNSLPDACKSAKSYTLHFLKSSPHAVGTHHSAYSIETSKPTTTTLKEISADGRK